MVEPFLRRLVSIRPTNSQTQKANDAAEKGWVVAVEQGNLQVTLQCVARCVICRFADSSAIAHAFFAALLNGVRVRRSSGVVFACARTPNQKIGFFLMLMLV